MNSSKTEKRNALTFVLFAIYLLVLTWLILLKLQFRFMVLDGRVLNLIPLRGSFDENGVLHFGDIRNNILSFIPFGIYICMLKREWAFAKKMLVIAALTLAYEAIQFIFVIGRADITDVLSNTLGGAIGIGIYALLSKLLKGNTNKTINGIAAALTTFVLFFVALLLANNRWVRIQ